MSERQQYDLLNLNLVDNPSIAEILHDNPQESARILDALPPVIQHEPMTNATVLKLDHLATVFEGSNADKHQRIIDASEIVRNYLANDVL